MDCLVGTVPGKPAQTLGLHKISNKFSKSRVSFKFEFLVIRVGKEHCLRVLLLLLKLHIIVNVLL